MFSDKYRLIKGCFGFFFSLGLAGIARLLIRSIIKGNWKLLGHRASVTLSSDSKNVYQAPPHWRDLFRGLANEPTGKTSQTSQPVQQMPKASMAFQLNCVASMQSVVSHLAPSLILLKMIKKTFPLFTCAPKSNGRLPAQPTTAVVPCVGCNFSNWIGPLHGCPKPHYSRNGHWTPPCDPTAATTTSDITMIMCQCPEDNQSGLAS